MQSIGSERQAGNVRSQATSIRMALWLTGLLLFVYILPAHAQFRASLHGTVADPTGAVIPGATVTLVDKDTNETRTSISDDVGNYSFNALPPDHFSIVASRPGFKKQEIAQVVLIPEQPNALNLELAIGDVQQTVTVNGSAAPLLDTSTATESATISSNQVEHMPSFQRNVLDLTQLTPGVQSDGAQSGGGGGFAAPGTQSGASFGGGGNLGGSSSIFATESGASANTNGQQFENNGYTVDGISTESAVWGGATVITPSQDSISSIRIVSNAYDAENGRFSGALTEIISQSGTNQLHGSFFGQIYRPGLNAYQRWNGPASVAPGTPTARGLLRDTSRYNQLGGSIGGPIWKNKIFAFFNYEGQSQNTSETGTGWYTTSQPCGAGSRRQHRLNLPRLPQCGGSGLAHHLGKLQHGRTDSRYKLRKRQRGHQHWFAAFHRIGHAGPDLRG